MDSLKGDISKKRFIVRLIRTDELNSLVNKVLGRVEVIWQRMLFTICIPMRFIVDRQIGTLLPVVRPGVSHSDCALKAPG